MSTAMDTLKIKNLPKELSEAQKESFARHFGATKVKVITSRAKEKAVVYAKFESPDLAKNVMQRIHQIKILNARLCVEYAENDILQGKPLLKTVSRSDAPDSKFFKSFLNKVNAFNDNVGFNQPPPSHLNYNYPKANRATINNIAHALATIPRFYTQVLHLMNKMNLPPPFAVCEPVASKKGVSGVQRPVTPLQQESVTTPTQQQVLPVVQHSQPIVQQQQVLTVVTHSQSIVHHAPQPILQNVVLPSVQHSVQPPKQQSIASVLQQPVVVPQTHIGEIPREIPKEIHEEIQQLGQIEVPSLLNISIPPPTVSVPTSPKVGEKRRKSSSESEIESDEDAKKFKEIIPEKRPKAEKKVVKRPKFIPPAVQLDHQKNEEEKMEVKVREKVEEVFEKVEVQAPPKKIELKVTTESLDMPQEPLPEDQLEVNVVAMIEPSSPIQDDDDNDDDDAHPCITLDELKSNQIVDFKDLPLFQNYDPGSPTNKVYIKNCSKTVSSEDLEYIYNRYREEGTEDKPSEFNIRLMKEGRMKGQAFVTLDSVEQAEKAVKETHGFILKDKPLWVAFGKAGTKKK